MYIFVKYITVTKYIQLKNHDDMNTCICLLYNIKLDTYTWKINKMFFFVLGNCEYIFYNIFVNLNRIIKKTLHLIIKILNVLKKNKQLNRKCLSTTIAHYYGVVLQCLTNRSDNRGYILYNAEIAMGI